MNKFKKMMLQSNAQQQQNMLNHYQKMPTIFDIFNRPLEDFSFFKDSGFQDSFKVDIEDCDDHYELKADLPGVKKEDIKLDFKDGVLSIKAAHHQNKNEKQNNFVLNERFEGTYERSFSFEDVDPQNIEASFDEGELKIKLNKLEKNPSVNIKIN